MSTVDSPDAVVVPPGAPAWDESKKFLVTRAWFRFLIIAVILIWVALITWTLVFAPIVKANVVPLEAGANLTLVLAPVLAAAAAVERTLETVFNVIEGSWRTLVAYLGRGLRWLKSAEIEVKQARQFLADASDKYNLELQAIEFGEGSVSALVNTIQARIESANRLVQVAQKRLQEAENNLADVTSSDNYISAKSAASIILGLLLGVVISTIAQLQIFAMLGIGAVPARIDVLITGLIIGSGAYPVHSLVGILQQGKDTLDSVKGYFNRAAPAVQQRITSVLPASESPTARPAVVETTEKSVEDKPTP
ncbi:MAG: hypothetical protein AB1649_23415 [Chloroflexota bacterium]